MTGHGYRAKWLKGEGLDRYEISKSLETAIFIKRNEYALRRKLLQKTFKPQSAVL